VSGIVRWLDGDDPRAQVGEDGHGPTCPHCGGCMEWEDCEECGGEGETAPGTLHDLDPPWYDPEDTGPCHLCLGSGGGWRCANSAAWCEANPLPGAGRAPTTAG
jgi:hypothetical protein